jgi:ParB family chromosome partitioning protein
MFSHVPLEQIKIAPDRQRRDLGDLEELKASLSSVGQINPLVVDDDYNLIAGERRYTAAKQLGWSLIAIQRKSDLDPLAREQIELDENIRRQDLTWQEHTQAIARYHALCIKAAGDRPWSVDDTAQRLGLNARHVRRFLDVAGAMTAGDPLVLDAPKFSVAYGVVERKRERARTVEGDKLDALLAPKPTAPITELSVDISNLDDESPIELDTSDWAPFECADFNEWSKEYSGPKFNFIHCDFPYGINADKHDQGSSKDFGGYEDGEEVYWNLIGTLERGMDNLVAESAHLMFWFSMNYYQKTKDALERMGWRVNPHPLVWHKIDNSGVLPDPKRSPRQIYETAFLCSRGDRFIVRAKSNAIGQPNTKTIHMSEKPRPMLNHFFQMFVDDTTNMLDPTCGSGNSVITAIELGGRAFGLECDESYTENAINNYYKWKEQSDATAQKRELTSGIDL